MGTMIGWLAAKQLFGRAIGEKAARALLTAGLFVAALLLCWGAIAAYNRSVIAHHEAGSELDQAKRERTADANLTRQIGRDQDAARQRKQEIDHATQGIADQKPSARQYARACVELRREAEERRQPPPAC